MLYILFNYIFKFLTLTSIFYSTGGDSASNNAELLYSGALPWGDSYYTSLIASADIDGHGGEELIITDDYGTFQVLGWDSVNQTFYQKWLSDPVFESHKINKIFIVPQHYSRSAYIIFSDSANNFRVYKWVNYLIEEDLFLKLKKSPTFQGTTKFIIGNFSHIHKGWDLISLSSTKYDILNKSFQINVLKTGYFINDFKPFSSLLLPISYKNPKLTIIYGFYSQPQQIAIIANLGNDKNSYKFSIVDPNYKTLKEYNFYIGEGEKIGWTGKIANGGSIHITTLLRKEKNFDKIRFYSIDDQIVYLAELNIPYNTSSWTLADMDNDGLRDLVVLDYMGHLHLYNLKKLLLHSEPK